MSLLAMNSLYKKGRGRVTMVQRININAMCYKDNYFPMRESCFEIMQVKVADSCLYS